MAPRIKMASSVQLEAEETDFHGADKIYVMEAIKEEIEDVIPNLLKDETMTEDFRDNLEMKQGMLENSVRIIETQIANNKFDPQAYFKKACENIR